MRAQNSKLVSGDTSESVTRTHRSAKPVGDFDEHIVAGRVSVAFIHGSEVIEISAQHRNLSMRLGRVELREERLAIPQARQTVMGRQRAVILAGPLNMECKRDRRGHPPHKKV